MRRMRIEATAHATAPAELMTLCALPIVKIALLCSVGAVCSRAGLLNLEGRKVVSGLVYNVFSPCLFLTKLAEFTLEDVIRLWPLTINMCLTHMVGAGLGLIFLRMAVMPRELHRHTMLATAVGESH